MKKNHVFAGIVAVACTLYACSKEEGTTTITYYQVDKIVEVDNSGKEILRWEYRFDNNGNLIWEYKFDEDSDFIYEYSIDALGRPSKIDAYWEGEGNHEYCGTEEYVYGSDFCVINDFDSEGTLVVKDSIIYNAQGQKTQENAFFIDEETGELYQDNIADYSYDANGNQIKLIYSDPNNPDYYFEQIKTYTYENIGDHKVYTLLETKYTWDGANYIWDNRISYEYDSNGNCIKEIKYVTDMCDELVFGSEMRSIVDENILSDNTYGAVYIPKQPNCNKQELTYNENGELVKTRTLTYSVHHTEVADAVSGNSISTKASNMLIVPSERHIMRKAKPVRK